MTTPNDNDSVTVDNIRIYIRDVMQGFVIDPPDTPYQRGYLAALYTIAHDVLNMRFEVVDEAPVKTDKFPSYIKLIK